MSDMNVRLAIAPIGWTNDDLPELGGQIPFEQCVSEMALAGCTGIDVISLLKKMKVEPESFHVIVEGDLTEEHPIRYRKMKVIYQFKGKDLPLDKIEKAVKLSEDKYCGVSAAYRLAMELSSEIRIIE